LKKRRKKGEESGEINWSLGLYMPVKEIEKKFGISELPKPTNIAPNQPFMHKKVYKWWGIFSLLALFLGIFILSTGSNIKVFEQRYTLDPVNTANDINEKFSEQPIHLVGKKNIKVTAASAVENSWLVVEGALINDETGLVQAFAIPVEYYSGVDGGESWSEGSKQDDVHFSSLPEGSYTLWLGVSREKFNQPAVVDIKIEQGKPRFLHLFLLLFLLSIIPIIVIIMHIRFESRRWAESSFGGSDE
jgi:hypothetical protein